MAPKIGLILNLKVVFLSCRGVLGLMLNKNPYVKKCGQDSYGDYSHFREGRITFY